MLNWLWITLISGLLFGFYDIFTKKALHKVPLLNVLTLYTFFNFVFVSFEYTNAMKADLHDILLVLVKSLCIFFGWILSFNALLKLPISIISPFNMLIPIFTILLGVVVLNEKLIFIQIVGIAVMLISYYYIGRVGTIEVKGLYKNKYLYLMVLSTFLVSISAILDKFILKNLNTGQMQFWFSLFVFLMYAVTTVCDRIKSKNPFSLNFNYLIILMSIFLVISDRLYFSAVKIPESQISVIMPLRRVSIFISTIIGGIIFKEKNLLKKFMYASLLILGIALIFIGK